jgi:Flp pilus assembly protein TadG
MTTRTNRNAPTNRIRFHPRGSGERGSTALELVVLAPVLLLVVSVLVYGGRVAIAGQAVQQAADEGAREASLARTAHEAKTRAESAARHTLDQQHLHCQHLTVTIDVGEFARPQGTPASVKAAVSCAVKVSDLAILGLPGTKKVAATATSPLDTYRERG